MPHDELDMKVRGFISYLDRTRYPGYGANLLRYDPDGFYRAMREFYYGKLGEI
jgi:hypothetical protein